MQLNENYKKELGQLIEDYMEAYQGQGLVISLVNKKGESIYRRYFGWRNVEKQLPITPDTIFGMASITKSFTA